MADDTVIHVTPATAFVDMPEVDVTAEDQPGSLTIRAGMATASVGAPDPTVSVAGNVVITSGRKHRWILHDPRTGETWEFPHNPNKMTSPHRARNLSIFVTPALYNPAVEARGGMARVWEGNIQPFEWSFSGRLKTEDQYEQLVYWTRKVHRVQLTDHFGRTWSIRFKEFDPDEQRPTPRISWKYDYDIKATMYGAAA